MIRAKSLLDSMMAGSGDVNAAAGARGLATRARGAWDQQSSLGKGAIAGGLLGVLLSGDARRLVWTGAKVGGAALIGALAFKAYSDWQAGKAAPAPDAPNPEAPNPEAPETEATDLPEPTGAFVMDDAFAERVLQAMVAAAKADGHVTPAERLRIDRQLARLGLEAEAQALIAAELDSGVDAGRIAGLARNAAEAVELYTASLLVVDPQGAAERAYLALLAARLGLAPGLVDHIHAQVA